MTGGRIFQSMTLILNDYLFAIFLELYATKIDRAQLSDV